MKILPYVYKLTHKKTNEFYIGVRWGNKYPADLDLGKRYWTSSKIVKPKFNEFNIQIIAEFFNSEDAIDHEQILIEKNWKNPLLLNKAIQVSKTFRCTGHTKETKLKISSSKKGKPPNNKGKKLSLETVEKIRLRSSQRRHSEQSIEKIRQKAMGNKRGLGNKSRLGRKQSIGEINKRKEIQAGKNPFLGKTHTHEAKEKIKAAMVNRPKLQCPYCHRALDPTNYKRYHGNRCKLYNDN